MVRPPLTLWRARVGSRSATPLSRLPRPPSGSCAGSSAPPESGDAMRLADGPLHPALQVKAVAGRPRQPAGRSWRSLDEGSAIHDASAAGSDSTRDGRHAPATPDQTGNGDRG